MTSAATWYAQPHQDRTAELAVDGFRRIHGGDPTGVWTAPGRVNLVGEHVDYNQGLCLPFAIGQRTHAAVRPRDDGLVRVWSDQESVTWEAALADVAPGGGMGWVGYVAGVLWAMRTNGYDVPGCDIAIVSEVPRGSGLSSSAALECAVAIAVDEIAGLGMGGSDEGRAQLAAMCVRAENEVAGAPTGGLDQAAALRCRTGAAVLLDCRDFTLGHVPFDPGAHGVCVLVMDTRYHHALVDGQYGDRRAECDRAAELLGVASLRDVPPGSLASVLAELPDDVSRQRVRHVVTEIDRVRVAAGLLQTARVHEIGPVLDASHRSLRDDFEVSCAELDLACDTAVASGALGARMTGGGFGGAAIALVPSGSEADVAAAVDAAFAEAGHRAPAFMVAVPSGAAARVR